MRAPVLGPAGLALLAGLSTAEAVRVRSRYHDDLTAARRRLARAGSHVANTSCGRVEYATAGDGTPVLEVHGIFGGFDQGLASARPVLGDGFRVIAPSRFGYLRTPLPPDASPAGQADAHVALLDHLGIDRAVVMAHSAGSVSALQLALRHPDRVDGLVLMVPAAPGPGPTAPPQTLVEALFRTDAVFWFVSTCFPRRLPIGVPRGWKFTADDHHQIAAMMEALLPATARREGFMFDMFISTPAINAGMPFSDIAARTLVVTAADDPLASPANARRLAALLPHARLLEVEHGGHLLLGQSEKVSGEVQAFIEQVSSLASAQPQSAESVRERIVR